MGLTQKLGTIPLAISTDASNNVGIGGSPSGSYKLEVTGNGKFTSSSFPLDVYGTTNNYGLRINNAQAATLFLYSSNANAANRNWGLFTNSEVFGDFDIRQSNAKDGDMTVGANSTSRLNINNLGNAAFTGQIKTSYVGQSMLISATTTASLRMQLINSGANAGVCIETSAGGDLFTGTSAYSMVIGTFTEKNFHIGTNSVTRLTVTSGGNVGVGITGVYSDVRFMTRGVDATASNYAFRAETSAAANLMYIRNDGLIVTGLLSGSPYNYTTGSAANMYVSGGGELQRSTSSLKYKTDVKDYDKGLSEVLQMRPVYYKGKNDGDTQFAGLIAEEIHDLGLTEFVQYAEDGTPDALSYANMIALLTKAIQELSAQNQNLKSRLDKAGL